MMMMMVVMVMMVIVMVWRRYAVGETVINILLTLSLHLFHRDGEREQQKQHTESTHKQHTARQTGKQGQSTGRPSHEAAIARRTNETASRSSGPVPAAARNQRYCM